MKTAVSEPGAGLSASAQIYGDLQAIIMTKQVEDSKNNSGLNTAQGALSYVQAALDASCWAQTADSVTYTDCVEGPATFNGKTSLNGDTVSFSLTLDIDPDTYNGPTSNLPAGSGVKVTINEVTVVERGDLTITASALTGTINAEIQVDMTLEMPGIGTQDAPQNTSIQATFDLQRDAAGCAVGGTMTVTSAGTTATAEYGPSCGQVTFR